MSSISAKSVSAMHHSLKRCNAPSGNRLSIAAINFFAEAQAASESGVLVGLKKTTSVERSARIGRKSLRSQAWICLSRAFSRRSRGYTGACAGNDSSKYSEIAEDSDRWKSSWTSVGTRRVNERWE